MGRDSYGVALLALALGCGLAGAVAAQEGGLHRRLLTLDTHLDTPANLERSGWDILRSNAAEGPFSQVDVPRMRQGGLDGGFWVLYVPQGPLTPEGYAAARETALQRSVRIREMVARSPQVFELAVNAEDAAAIAGRGKLVVYQSIENSYPLGEDLSLFKTFYDLGVRMASPVHGANNQFADSATDPVKRWNGLSPLGRAWVAEANRLGIVIDGSHASDETVDQLLQLSKSPIILSHHGAKAVFDHPRNLDDERLRRVAAAGGVIQVNSMYVAPTKAYPELRAKQGRLRFLLSRWGQLKRQEREEVTREIADFDAAYPGWRGTFDDFMANLLHILKLVGPDHVGLGVDWDGGGGVVGLESVEQLPKVTARLRREGYSDEDLGKIWGGNVLRLLAQAETYRDQVAAPAQP